MKILVTSGGTKIPIDKVRDITNMSSGTFGTKIAEEFLDMGHEVLFFRAKDSKSPMQYLYEFPYQDPDSWTESEKVSMWATKRAKWAKNYKECVYRTFQDYLERLERWIKFEQPDVVVLAAAVSDYGVVNPHPTKIRSNDALKIELTQLPKIIYYIKEWAPNCKLVGFKLLVNSKEYQLVEAAQKSIQENKCDMIVANDLQDIKDNNHRVHLIFPNGEVKTFKKRDSQDPNYLAQMVATHSIQL